MGLLVIELNTLLVCKNFNILFFFFFGIVIDSHSRNFGMYNAPVVRLIVWPADLQPSAQQLCYDYPIIIMISHVTAIRIYLFVYLFPLTFLLSASRFCISSTVSPCSCMRLWRWNVDWYLNDAPHRWHSRTRSPPPSSSSSCFCSCIINCCFVLGESEKIWSVSCLFRKFDVLNYDSIQYFPANCCFIPRIRENMVSVVIKREHID